MKKKVLIIDDEQPVLNFLFVLLAQSGKYDTETLKDSTEALDLIKKQNFDLLILDMDMPEVTGLEILKFINENRIDIETIVLTGVEDVDLAVSAMKAGAYDYLRKPVDNDLLLLTMERALERKSMRQEIAQLKMGDTWESVKNKKAFEGIITRNPKMIKIFKFIEKIAPADNSVLIMGESGTGKELVARAIHKASLRRDKQFLAVNAGAFARELFASEFFGYVRGAFSGADTDKKGFLEESDGGTLFLDEIGELPIEVQVKLLRVLQDGEFFRVGSTKLMRADIRLLAATNKNLWEEIEKGTFRKDLFYRLNVNTISIPPLRERRDDIPILAYYFLDKFNLENNRNIKDISDKVIKMFNSYNFPGNVREFQNIITSSALIEQSSILTVHSLPSEFLTLARKEKRPQPVDIYGKKEEALFSLEEMEREHIGKILEITRGNRTQASRILGISRATLVSKLKKYKFRDVTFTDND